MSTPLSSVIYIEGVEFSYRAVERKWRLPIFKPVYRQVPVLNGVNLNIGNEGGVYAVLGRNGAGKTTLIKMICGLLKPQAGAVKVNSFIPHKQQSEFLRSIGVMFGHKSALWPELTLEENKDLFCAIYKKVVPLNVFDALLEQFQLDEVRGRAAKTYSLGQAVKANLALHIALDPRLLVLDEPTIGLDVEAQIVCRDAIRDFARRGRTVLLTTHNMMDIARTSANVYFLADGGLKIIESHATLSHAEQVLKLEELFA